METKDIKVLIIDDDILFIDMVSLALKSMGYNVQYLSATSDINKTICDFLPSIILLDVVIGDKNGIDESLLIKEKHPELPIIFISANPLDCYIKRAIDNSGVAFLKKPCSIIEISTFINKYAVATKNSITIGSYELILDLRILKDNITDEIYDLYLKEFDILLQLVNNKNNIVNIEEFIQCFEANDENKIQKIYNIITKLRKCLKGNKYAIIKTYKNKGYMLKIAD